MSVVVVEERNVGDVEDGIAESDDENISLLADGAQKIGGRKYDAKVLTSKEPLLTWAQVAYLAVCSLVIVV